MPQETKKIDVIRGIYVEENSGQIVQATHYYTGPVIHQNYAGEQNYRIRGLASLTKWIWSRFFWRRYARKVIEFHNEVEGINKAFFELTGVITPGDMTLYVDDTPKRLTSLVFGNRLAGGYKRLTVLGGPGSGKTTLLRHAASVQANFVLSRRFFLSRIPVYADLRYYSGGNFLRFLQTRITSDNPDLMGILLNDRLADGNTTLYLDSLNEMPSAVYHDNIIAIQDFIERYPNNQIIIACRTDEYNNEFSGIHAQILPLDDNSIKQYIQGYMIEDIKGQALYDRLSAENLLDAVRNPFALLIVIRTGVVPHNQGQLFDEFVKMLLARDRAKGDQGRKYERLSDQDFFESIASLAYFFSIETHTLVASKAACRAYLQEHIAPESNRVLDHGLDTLLLRYEDTSHENISFWHQSILSYFTALYVATHWNELDSQVWVMILTQVQFWEMFSLIGSVMKSDKEREQLATRITTVYRPDLIGAALAITILDDTQQTEKSLLDFLRSNDQTSSDVAQFMTEAEDALKAHRQALQRIQVDLESFPDQEVTAYNENLGAWSASSGDMRKTYFSIVQHQIMNIEREIQNRKQKIDRRKAQLGDLYECIEVIRDQFTIFFRPEAESTPVDPLASLIRLSNSSLVVRLVALYMPQPKAIDVLKSVRSEECVAILVDYWRREQPAESPFMSRLSSSDLSMRKPFQASPTLNLDRWHSSQPYGLRKYYGDELSKGETQADD